MRSRALPGRRLHAPSTSRSDVALPSPGRPRAASVEELFDAAGALRRGHFVLKSGRHSSATWRSSPSSSTRAGGRDRPPPGRGTGRTRPDAGGRSHHRRRAARLRDRAAPARRRGRTCARHLRRADRAAAAAPCGAAGRWAPRRPGRAGRRHPDHRRIARRDGRGGRAPPAGEPLAAAVIVDRSHGIGGARLPAPCARPDRDRVVAARRLPALRRGRAAPQAREQLAPSALRATGEAPGREVQRGDDVGAEAEDRAADQGASRSRRRAPRPVTSASRYDCVKRRFVTGRTIRPSSTSQTPLRVRPVTTIVRGSRMRVYQKSVTSRPRSTSPRSASGDSEPGSSVEVGRQRPERAGAGHRVAGRRGAERLGGAAVVDEAARDACLHELVAALRCSLRVEADAHRHRVRWRRRRARWRSRTALRRGGRRNGPRRRRGR